MLGNYSMGLQSHGKADFLAEYAASGDAYSLITNIIGTMPLAQIVLAIVLITMIAFYSTSFDSIALTASCYSYRSLKNGELPHKSIQLLWCILLILLPIALILQEVR